LLFLLHIKLRAKQNKFLPFLLGGPLPHGLDDDHLSELVEVLERLAGLGARQRVGFAEVNLEKR
jgi:hypothetical protein